MIRVSLRTITRERFDAACLCAATHPLLVPYRSSNEMVAYSGVAVSWAGFCVDGSQDLRGSLMLAGAFAYVISIAVSLASHAVEKREARS